MSDTFTVEPGEPLVVTVEHCGTPDAEVVVTVGTTPEAHAATHAAGAIDPLQITSQQITDFASAVVAAAPPTTNASLLTSGTLPDARLSSNIARTSDVSSAVAAVVNAAPASLDTLKELADALGNDANFASTVTNAIAGKAAAVHTHVIADVTGLQTALDGKQASGSYAAAVHTHGINDVTGLQAALDGKAASSHTHTASAITDFAAAVVAAAPPTTDASLLTTGTLSASRLPSTTVAAGSYGSASSVATYTVDATGRLTAAGSTSIAIAAGAVSGLASIATSGSASDLSAGTVPFARLPVGTSSTSVAAGNDARLSDTRTPTDGSVTDAKITSGGLSASSINWVAIQPWAANTAYQKGDLVSFQGIAYRRSAAGTSGATFNAANWQQITPSEFVASQVTSGTLADSRLSANARQAIDNLFHPFLLAGM